MHQNEQNSTSQNLRCKNDKVQQITRQNDKMKTQDEKTMNTIQMLDENCDNEKAMRKR